MDEYISREELRKHLKECYDNELFDADMRKATIGIDVYVENMPAADVQPVDRWISVDEALPIYDGLVLAVDKNNTIRLGIYTDLGWTSQFGNPMVAHITHWQPLPEPPKDGDTNGYKRIN